MPTYEFRCPNGHRFELFQSMSDDPPAGCEVCGEGPLEHVLYPVAVHFKGSGFYSTDYGRGGVRRTKDGDSSGGSSDGGSSEGGSSDSGSDSKPDKTEKKAAEA